MVLPDTGSRCSVDLKGPELVRTRSMNAQRVAVAAGAGASISIPNFALPQISEFQLYVVLKDQAVLVHGLSPVCRWRRFRCDDRIPIKGSVHG